MDRIFTCALSRAAAAASAAAAADLCLLSVDERRTLVAKERRDANADLTATFSADDAPCKSLR